MATEESYVRNARAIGNMLRFGVPLAIIMMVLSCFEKSIPWAVFVCLTGWCGLAAGYSAGTGLADFVLHRIPADRRPSNAKWQLVAILTFWGPTLSMPILGGVLMVTLKDDQAPISLLGPFTIMQSLATYFGWAGAAWWVVTREIRRMEASTAD